jgi:hypothetical protein
MSTMFLVSTCFNRCTFIARDELLGGKRLGGINLLLTFLALVFVGTPQLFTLDFSFDIV